MQLPQDLLGPEITLAETHISWVFLGKSDVFKVKKPVFFGFLDFRTIEDRKAACEAEVRLNGRLSSGVYRGVVPIYELEGRASLTGSTIVDWAVHMTRLSDDVRADRLLATNALTVTMIDRIADRIAEFHATARGDAETSRFGTPEAIAVNVSENFHQTRETIAAAITQSEATEIERWQTDFLKNNAPLFADRIAQGHVRDGHGDLRLEHVYLGEVPTIIDCIEFNDRFRYADVCADIAFLSMDLASHGRVDLAERLLARYARQANDFDLYAVVDFYESYRAYVRGKISTMSGDAAAARRHFLLALSSERRSLLAPTLVAVGGIIASGKSTVADCLGDELSAPIIDADRTRKSMLGVAATQPVHEGAWQGAYDPAFTEKVYAEVLRRAKVVLASGRPVVLDASFRSPSMRNGARTLATEMGVPFRFVECRVDAEVCRARLTKRAQERGVSDGRLEILDAFAARFEAVVELPAAEHVVLDTAQPVETSLRTLRERVATWPRGFVG